MLKQVLDQSSKKLAIRVRLKSVFAVDWIW